MPKYSQSSLWLLQSGSGIITYFIFPQDASQWLGLGTLQKIPTTCINKSDIIKYYSKEYQTKNWLHHNVRTQVTKRVTLGYGTQGTGKSRQGWVLPSMPRSRDFQERK